eukprot:2265495-Alexandrium_andersonii.AAC.1
MIRTARLLAGGGVGGLMRSLRAKDQGLRCPGFFFADSNQPIAIGDDDCCLVVNETAPNCSRSH